MIGFTAQPVNSDADIVAIDRAKTHTRAKALIALLFGLIDLEQGMNGSNSASELCFSQRIHVFRTSKIRKKIFKVKRSLKVFS